MTTRSDINGALALVESSLENLVHEADSTLASARELRINNTVIIRRLETDKANARNALNHVKQAKKVLITKERKKR